jgi:hypothetical protein
LQASISMRIDIMANDLRRRGGPNTDDSPRRIIDRPTNRDVARDARGSVSARSRSFKNLTERQAAGREASGTAFRSAPSRYYFRTGETAPPIRFATSRINACRSPGSEEHEVDQQPCHQGTGRYQRDQNVHQQAHSFLPSVLRSFQPAGLRAVTST